VAAVLALALTVLGPGAAAGAAPPLSRAQLAHGADHACVVGRASVPVDWAALGNPVLSAPAAGEKDEAVVFARGRWHALFSYLTGTDTVAHWTIATATSPDLVHWSTPRPWPRQSGTFGLASPDVVRDPAGTFVVTYQSDPGQTAGGQDQLYERTSTDLVHFSPPRPLAPGLARRMIDGALAFTGHGVILGYKQGSADATQAFELAWSPSGSLAGPWHRLGPADITVNGGTVENDEFVWVDGAWHLVATSNNLDQPFLFTLAGDPADPASWTHWVDGRQLHVPAQAWDHGPGLSSVGFEQDNSAYLCVDGSTDLLFYAGSHELTRFGGWGQAALGVARSTDLVHWTPAAPREGG
jgi:hypothetical protein